MQHLKIKIYANELCCIFKKAIAKIFCILKLDWFINCFIVPVTCHCLDKGIPFKIILLLDNAPGHPPYLDELHPDVTVV
jgi:hypothetical protein